MSSTGRVLKMVAVGDGQVGKTCLLIAYTQGAFDESYVPTVFDNYAGRMNVDGEEYNYTLWDTAGQEGYDRCRVLSYSQTQVFLVCFNLESRNTLENVQAKWLPEIRKECGEGVPAVLVGTKSDLRTNPPGPTSVSYAEGKRLAKKMRMADYVECSAKARLGLDKVFESAVHAAIKPFAVKKKGQCVIL